MQPDKGSGNPLQKDTALKCGNKLTNSEKAVVSYLLHTIATLSVDRHGLTDEFPFIFLTDAMHADLCSAFAKIRAFKTARRPTELSFDENTKETVLQVLAQFIYAERTSIGKITEAQAVYMGEVTKNRLHKAVELLEIEATQLV